MANKKAESSVSVNQNLPNKLLSCLYSQRRTGRYCDVILNVGDVKFSVHSCVLASFSPYFNEIFLSTSNAVHANADNKRNRGRHVNDPSQKDSLEHWSLRNPLNLTFPIADGGYERRNIDCSDCTAKVLDFMYLGKIQIQNEHIDHVKSLSSILEVAELLLICDKYNEKCESRRKRKSKLPNRSSVKKPRVNINLAEVEPVESNVISDDKMTVEEITDKKDNTETNEAVKNNEETNGDTTTLPVPVQDQTVGLDSGDSGTSGIISNSEKKVECSPPNDNVDSSKSTDPYSCSICELKFSSLVLLRQHRETHRGRLNTCYACRFSTYKAFELIKHLLEADHQELVCSLCLFEAETPEKLKDHLQQHNHPKPFFCTICNVRFQTRAALNTHTTKHSTEMPFSCSVCNRAFKWKQGLQNHMTVHTPEKKHLCSECGFSTAYQSTFRAHTLVHTSNMFLCPHAGCNFKSVRKQNYVSHLMTHNKDKPYQCEVCGQSYSQSKNLRRHAIKHDAVAEEFLERCPLCLYQTMRLDKLKIHYKKHHPEEDEQLLNLRRRKKPMLQRDSRNTLKTVNHSDINIPEKVNQTVPLSMPSSEVETSKPFPTETEQVQLSNRKDCKPNQDNSIIVNSVQLPQDIANGNATTFIITGLTTQLQPIITTREVEKTSLNHFQLEPMLSSEEGTIILLDDLNTLFVPAGVNTVSDIVAVKPSEISGVRPIHVANGPLKTVNLNENNDNEQTVIKNVTVTVNNSLNPIDNLQNPGLGTSNTESSLNNNKTNDSNQIQKLLSGDSFTVTLNSVNESQMQQLSAIVEDFNSGEVPQPTLSGSDDSSVLSTTVGNLINEQLQALTSHKEDSSLDVLNNNVIQELFADGPGTDLDEVAHQLSLNDDSTNTLDILSKDVPQLVGNEETLGVVLDNSNKDEVLLCHETISDDADNIHDDPSERSSNRTQNRQGCDTPELHTFQSFESILESLSLPEKI